MAKKRTIVKGLNVDATNLSGISTKALASPVDTYVRPAQEKSTLSPLSQFINAITPAVKAVEDKKLEEKLKRERQIENFNFNKKQAQVKNEALITHTQMNNSYDRNPELYLNTPDETIVADIDRHTFKYVETLRASGADELHIEAYKADMENRKVKFLADINDKKKDNVIKQENTQIRNAAIAVSEQNKILFRSNKPEDRAKAIDLLIDLINVNAESYPTIEGKADKKRMNKLLLGLADDVKESDPDNIYLAALEKLKQLTTSENLDKGSELIANRNKFAVKNNKKIELDKSVQYAIDSGTIVSTFGIDANKEDVISSVFRSTVEVGGERIPFTKLNTKQRADIYKKIDVLPEFETNLVKNALTRITSGASDTVEDNEMLKQGFQQYQILKAAGIPTSKYLNPDEERLMEGLDLLIIREAKQPQMIKENVFGQLNEDEYLETVDYTSASYVAAAKELQGYSKDKEPSIDSKMAKEIRGELSSMFGTAIADLPSSELLFKEAIEDYRYFMALTGNKAQSLARAVSIVKKNNPIVKAGGGDEFEYGFTHLAANLPMGLDAPVVVSKMNKSLGNNPALQELVLKTKGLGKDEFSVALTPHPIDPTKLRVRIIDLREGEEKASTYLSGVDDLDKVKILSDPKVLYKMIAEDLQRVKEAPDENSIESLVSFDNDERRERKPKKIGDDLVDYIAGSPEAALDLVKGIGDTIVKATQSEKDLITEVENAKKIGDDLVDYIKGSPAAAINNIRALLSGDINLINPAGASTLEENNTNAFTQVNIPSNKPIGEQVTIEGNTTEDKTANMIATQEGFSSTPYADGKDKSVGFGFYLPALEDDEKALIKDVNNVTKEEGVAVLKLKVQKIGNYLEKEMQGFRNLPEEAQTAIISMGYQLGVTNLPKTWKKFTAAIKEAGQYEEGSTEQAEALAKAKFEMLYSKTKDGKTVLNKWAKQTKERAFEMANAVSDANLSV